MVQFPQRHEVELEGIEPSSKQGHPVLSTRLSQTEVFECWQDLGHRPTPYPLKFHRTREAANGYPQFSCTTEPESFGAKEPLSDVPSQHLVPR